MAFLTISSPKQRIIIRIQERLTRLDTTDRSNQEVLLRIALLLAGQAKINVRRQGVVDSGFLLNKIKSEISTKISNGVSRITVGPRGVKYAAMNEFGGIFTDRQRMAMFAELRRQGKLGRPSKHVITGKIWRARPYLRPVIPQTRQTIRAIMRDFFGS